MRGTPRRSAVSRIRCGGVRPDRRSIARPKLRQRLRVRHREAPCVDRPSQGAGAPVDDVVPGQHLGTAHREPLAERPLGTEGGHGGRSNVDLADECVQRGVVDEQHRVPGLGRSQHDRPDPRLHEHVRREDRPGEPAPRKVELRRRLGPQELVRAVDAGDVGRHVDEAARPRLDGRVHERADTGIVDRSRRVRGGAPGRVRGHDHRARTGAGAAERGRIPQVARHPQGAPIDHGVDVRPRPGEDPDLGPAGEHEPGDPPPETTAGADDECRPPVGTVEGGGGHQR